MKKKEEKTMTKQEEINQLIKIVCPHLECEDGEPSITLGGFEAIQDFYAARIKERDERILEKVKELESVQAPTESESRFDKETGLCTYYKGSGFKTYVDLDGLEQIMKGEEKDDV